MEQNSDDSFQERSLLGSFVLVSIAVILLLSTSLIGFLFALIDQGFAKGQNKLKKYLYNVALVLDQAGNVIMQHFLNAILLKKRPNTYLFGNKKETISSVIGKNFLLHSLSPLGLIVNGVLNKIDSNHTLDSIELNVKSKTKPLF